MGHWGFELLDNDTALGIQGVWDKEIKGLLKTYPNEWPAQKVLDFFLENHFNGKFEYGDFYNNIEILALAKLFIDSNLTLPSYFKEVVENVVAIELSEKSLKEWENKKRRERVLLRLLKDIGGEFKKKKVKNKYSAIEFPDRNILFEKIKIWLDSDEALEREYPRFLKTIDKLIVSQLGYDYGKLYLEGTKQRMMLLAFHLGTSLDLPKAQVLQMVKIAKEKVTI